MSLFSSMTFVFIYPRKIASNFGYSLALSIVNNFDNDLLCLDPSHGAVNHPKHELHPLI
jgi:hypothetical protein